jgi:hypothetical protein
MSASVRQDLRSMYAHWCPSVDAPIDEFDPAIIDCRCYTSREFFAAQDAMAVKLDLERGAAE